MTQEEKDLLLKDLCARMPYGVKFQSENIETALFVDISDGEVWINGTCIDDFKPYLYPLSSMTDEQIQELESLMEVTTIPKWGEVLSPTPKYYDWLDKNKFDYRGLIPKGLANDAIGLGVY